jgi:ketosteroid isomerase-like protein
MSASIREIVRDYNQAFGDGDFDRVGELLHPDVVFGGAAREVRGASAYIDGIRRLGRILVRNDIKQILVDGNQAYVLYDFVTSTPAGAVLSGELLTVEDGLIRSITLLWDMRRWPEVVAELAKLPADDVVAANA